MIRMDAKILSKKNHLHSAHQTCGCGDAIVFSRLRPDYGAPRKKPIHLWLSARKRCKAAMHVWAHYHQNQCWPFSWERFFLGRSAAGCEVCFGFWIFLLGR